MSKGILGRLDSLVNELGEGRACWGHDFIDAAVDAMDRIEELQAKLAKAIEALDEAIYLLDPDEEDITKETGLYRIVKAFKELKGEQP